MFPLSRSLLTGSTLRTGIVEEQNIRGNGSVGRKDTARQTYNGVQVEIPEQLCLNGNLCVICSKEGNHQEQ